MAKTNKKPTGRPKGSKNKVSSDNKKLLINLVNGYFDGETLAGDISMLTPKERTDFMAKLHSLTAPKETQAEVNVSQVKHPHIGNYLTEEEIETYNKLLNNEDNE